MGLSDFTLRLLVLFLPGIITKLIVDQLTVHEEKRHFYFVIHSFVYGFFAYLLYGLILNLRALFYAPTTGVQFIKSLLDKSQTLDAREIIWVTALSVVNGLVLALVINRKYFHRLAQCLRITNKFADLDVWSYFHNARNEELRWVTVRDLRNDLMYEGYVVAFSDTVKEAELFLQDVSVFRDQSGEKLYDVPAVYLFRKQDEITIEFRALQPTEEAQSQDEGSQGDKEV